MSGFVIREARSADREQIGVLWLQLMQHHHSLDTRFNIASDGVEKYVRHTHEMIRSRNARVLVAEDVGTGEIIAYLMGEIQTRPVISIPGVYGFVSDVFVLPEWRKGGVGSALFTEMKRWFVEKKAIAVELYISESNPEAAAFWQAMGMTPFLKLLHLDL